MSIPVLSILDKAVDIFKSYREGKVKAEDAEAAFKVLQEQHAHDVVMGQIEVNKIEAASESLFKSGWRPGVGWMGVIGLGYQALLQPVLTWASLNFGWVAPPVIDTNDLMVILTGILGLGAYRSFDKKNKK